MEDSWSDIRILSTKWSPHCASSIGVSISDAPKLNFPMYAAKSLFFAQNWNMYYGKAIFFKITHLFSSHISPRIGFLALKWRRRQIAPESAFRSAQITSRWSRYCSPWSWIRSFGVTMARRTFISHFQVAQYPISSILHKNSVYLEATLPHVGYQNA